MKHMSQSFTSTAQLHRADQQRQHCYHDVQRQDTGLQPRLLRCPVCIAVRPDQGKVILRLSSKSSDMVQYTSIADVHGSIDIQYKWQYWPCFR